ncbi:ribose-phosphate pyrophosphokinase [Clostridium boliviensis]|uniref:ribose-phosphate diphosphokinase n=1 Tax=Clostridium boliviensis TaxID=318465 RepID=A0ABU4GNP4_9CLOT|nr:ribose-phosphate pyrophosphokinase [Clostridium boliviensis]MDW2799241.1 ribose-phosphate pyrophosphokinase [Clostridium boliviensis]
MSQTDIEKDFLPVGELSIIALKSSEAIGNKVNNFIVDWRNGDKNGNHSLLQLEKYSKSSYLLDAECPRFGTGEAKGTIKQSVRGKDIFILADVSNYSISYNVCGEKNRMSPDDHFQDLKRIIAAIGGKARRLTVIMPFLYEGRQHKRSSRESLDCALALQELTNMGVENILTFDAHDPRVQNAIPLKSFETIWPTYQFIKALVRNIPDLKLDSKHTMIVSPDEGAMSRSVYYANILGVDMGMFYKRRDYSIIIDGSNPIAAHEFLGTNVEGKDVIVIDDMIASGGSILDTAKELKKRKAGRIIVCATFGLFTGGLKKFDEAYEQGLIYRIISTNLTYQSPEVLSRPYYISTDMSKFIALLIETLNHNTSISELMKPDDKIHRFLNRSL